MVFVISVKLHAQKKSYKNFVEKFREIEQKKISEKFVIGSSDPTITLLALAFWVQILRRNQLHFKKVLLNSQ